MLKVPPADIRAAMGAFRAPLGVPCNYCHVQGDFASDDKEHVTCYTCHRGKAQPETAPAPAQ